MIIKYHISVLENIIYNLSNEIFKINSIIDISKLCADLKSIKRPPNIYGVSPRYRLDFKDDSNKLLFSVKILGGDTTIFIYDINRKEIDAGQNITMIREFFRILKNKSPEEYKKLKKRLKKYHIAEKFLD